MPTGIYVRDPEIEAIRRAKISVALKGSKSPCFKGQPTIRCGYTFIYQPNHLRADNRGYVKHAILVMEETLGRLLTVDEVVDHKNKIKNDDNPKNLRLFPNRIEHTRFHSKNGDHFQPPHIGEGRTNWTPELRQRHSRVMKEVRAKLASQGKARIGGRG